jgi:dihydrolipoamide dehydrogenase
MYAEARNNFAAHGVLVDNVRVDVAAMMKQKGDAVDGLTKGIEGLFKKNKVEYVRGWGRLAGGGKVEVDLADGGKATLSAKNVVIATGSEVAPLPGVEVDEERCVARQSCLICIVFLYSCQHSPSLLTAAPPPALNCRSIVSSTGALSLQKVPDSLVVVGGGIIGLELGSVWARLGAAVTVVEFTDAIAPSMDAEVRRQFKRVLEKQGLKFKLSTAVKSAEKTGAGIRLSLEPAKGGAAEQLDADVVLVATGRRPFTAGLGLEAAGVEVDARGRIPVDAHFKTNVAGVYAIGDVVPGPMLAHKAEEDGIACVEGLAGRGGHVNYATVPSVVYTWPEVAWVGRTEDELKAAGVKYKAGKFSFMANSRARTSGETDGMVKVLADAATDKVLGVHIMGAAAGELIGEAVLAMEYGASAEDIARTCHAHPTLSEAVKEAALATFAKAIHM